jgi:hypothetical protein
MSKVETAERSRTAKPVAAGLVSLRQGRPWRAAKMLKTKLQLPNIRIQRGQAHPHFSLPQSQALHIDEANRSGCTLEGKLHLTRMGWKRPMVHKVGQGLTLWRQAACFGSNCAMNFNFFMP